MMERKGNGSASTSESFFFKIYPNYFKVDHGFAKTIKPNTNYRLTLFKGIQKADELVQPIKGKLVGGKILFDEVSLNISLPIYMPNRNIEFIIKILETKPNQAETEIASHKIKSGDFIKKFKENSATTHKQDAPLLNNLSLVFDLFVHNSKAQLQKIAKKFYSKSKQESRANIANNKGSKTPRKNQFASEVYSESDRASETGSNNDGGLSSRKKLNRKRGHDGRLRSRHGSRENSVVSSRSKSPGSDRKSLGPFPHTTQKDERFIRSPKKEQPSHVEGQETNNKGKKENYVSISKDESSLPGRTGTPTREGRGRHELELNIQKNMFDIERRIQRTKSPGSHIAESAQKQESRPPLPTKAIGRKNHAMAERQIQQNQPVSKPTASKASNKEETEDRGPDNISIDTIAPFVQRVNKAESIKSPAPSLPHIQVKDKPIAVSNRDRSEIGMKSSQRLSELHHDEECEQSAGKEFNGMRDRLFYVIFTVTSLLLFWNALTPTRKV